MVRSWRWGLRQRLRLSDDTEAVLYNIVSSPVWLAGETLDYWHCAGLTSHHWQPWQPGAGPGLVVETRGDQSWTGEQLTMGRPGLESGETSPPVSPRQLTRPGLPVRVHTLHDTSIPFLPPLGFTNHSPGRSDKQMQRETHAAPELHPRLFHSITPDPQSVHSTPEMKWEDYRAIKICRAGTAARSAVRVSGTGEN